MRSDILILVLLNLNLFLPNLGRGLIHDDFLWLHQAAFQPLS